MKNKFGRNYSDRQTADGTAIYELLGGAAGGTGGGSSETVDDITIERNADDGDLQVKDGGISASKLGSDVVLAEDAVLSTNDPSGRVNYLIRLSQAEYDNLDVKDPQTLYIIY